MLSSDDINFFPFIFECLNHKLSRTQGDIHARQLKFMITYNDKFLTVGCIQVYSLFIVQRIMVESSEVYIKPAKS